MTARRALAHDKKEKTQYWQLIYLIRVVPGKIYISASQIGQNTRRPQSEAQRRQTERRGERHEESGAERSTAGRREAADSFSLHTECLTDAPGGTRL